MGAVALLLTQTAAHAQSIGFSLTILDAGVPLKTTVSAINDFGQIVGTVGDGGGRHGVLWRDGVAYDLGMPTHAHACPRMPTHATGINNRGQVSGDESFSEQVYDTAMVWTSPTPTRLAAGSSAAAINDAGQVAGTTYNYGSDHTGGAERAMRWDGTTAHMLNSPAGNTATEATSINNAGQVVGMATNIATGMTQPFLLSLTSVPEPSSAAMMLLGGGALAWRVSRRRATRSA
jgi:uncharacterized membrane protein